MGWGWILPFLIHAIQVLTGEPESIDAEQGVLVACRGGAVAQSRQRPGALHSEVSLGLAGCWDCAS